MKNTRLRHKNRFKILLEWSFVDGLYQCVFIHKIDHLNRRQTKLICIPHTRVHFKSTFGIPFLWKINIQFYTQGLLFAKERKIHRSKFMIFWIGNLFSAPAQNNLSNFPHRRPHGYGAESQWIKTWCREADIYRLWRTTNTIEKKHVSEHFQVNCTTSHSIQLYDKGIVTFWFIGHRAFKRISCPLCRRRSAGQCFI